MEEKQFNAYTIKLTDYIIHNHPDRIMDKEFIHERGLAATATFAQCSRSGMDFEEASRNADAVLYRGLLFSPYRMIDGIVDTLYPEIYNLGIHRESLLMQMLAYVKPTLDSYHNEENDASFQGSEAYETAYRHVTRLINQFVYDHGLQ